jgi:hypothetical protein
MIVMEQPWSNPTLKFAPSGRWDAPSARPLALRSPDPKTNQEGLSPAGQLWARAIGLCGEIG